MDAPRFAVVDIETSGLSTRRHRIVQIGVVTIEPDGRVVDEWSTLVGLDRWWQRVGTRDVHGITRRDLRGAPRGAAVLTELAARLDGAVFTAHNADFDAAFLDRAARRHRVELQLRPRVCTLRLSRWLDPDRQQLHSLTALCERYDVELRRHHDALADAHATAALLPHLLAAHGFASNGTAPNGVALTAGLAALYAP